MTHPHSGASWKTPSAHGEESGGTPNRAPRLVALPAAVRTLGRYRLIGEIARGGMGIVYLGIVQGLAGFSKLFAIKDLRPELSDDEEAVALFLEEARLAAKMSHPNVVQTFEMASQDGHHFIAMEYLDGQPLARVISQCKASQTALPIPYALWVLGGVLDGLHYAHTLTDFDGTQRGVVHRDVSPHNVFVTFDGGIKVLDFGVAKAADSSHQTETGVLKGKVAYMSPEQALGLPVDARSDIFAVGVMLWEAIAGRRLWADAGNDVAILRRLLNSDLPDLRAAMPDAPPGLLAIVARATAVSPQERYPTAAEMRGAIDAFVEEANLGKYGARDVTKLTGQLFETERTEMKARIDREIKLLAQDPLAEPGDPPTLSEGARETPSRSQSIDNRTGAALASRPSTEAAGGRGSMRWIAIGGGLGLALAAVAIVRTTWVAPSHRASSVEPATVAVPAPAPAPTMQTVQMSVNATPSAAQIFIDDQPFAGNPAAGSFPRDGQLHRVRAEAAGFAPGRLEIPFDHDRSIAIALVPLAPTSEPTGRPRLAPVSPQRTPVRKKDDLEPF